MYGSWPDGKDSEQSHSPKACTKYLRLAAFFFFFSMVIEIQTMARILKQVSQ
jgi:hypothetical protein